VEAMPTQKVDYEPLWRWADANDPSTKRKDVCGKGYNLKDSQRPAYFWDQILFVQNNIALTVFGVPKERVVVVQMHHAKGVTLPVMQFEWGDFVFTMRYNYIDWCVSVRSPKTMERVSFLGLFDPDTEANFVGFPVDYRYGLITANEYVMSSQFSFMVKAGGEKINYHTLWAIFWIIREWWKDKYEARFGNPPIVPVPDF
jgi:hypothetical protein